MEHERRVQIRTSLSDSSMQLLTESAHILHKLLTHNLENIYLIFKLNISFKIFKLLSLWQQLIFIFTNKDQASCIRVSGKGMSKNDKIGITQSCRRFLVQFHLVPLGFHQEGHCVKSAIETPDKWGSEICSLDLEHHLHSTTSYITIITVGENQKKQSRNPISL